MGDQVNFTQTLSQSASLPQVITWLNAFARAVQDASARNLIQNVNGSGAALSSINNALAGQIPVFTGPSTAVAQYEAYQAINVVNAGADPTGAADSTSALTTVIGSGAKHLYWPDGTYKISTALSQPSGQHWQGSTRNGVIIKWAGGNNSDVIATASQSLYNIIENFTIDVGTATGCTALHLVDTQHARVSGITMQATGAGSASGVGLRMQSGSGGTGQNFNTAFNDIRHIRSILYGVGLQCDGVSSGPTVVTDNTIFNCDFEKALTGVRLAQWCDNNKFFWTRVEVEQANTFGVIHNDSGTPGSDVGVYANDFFGLGVDAFGAASNVAAIFFNVTKQNVAYLYHSPDAFPGSLVVDNSGRSNSHHVTVQNIDNTTNAAYTITKNWAIDGPTTLITVANGLNSNLAYISTNARVNGASAGFSVGGFLPTGQSPADGVRLRIYNGTGQQMTIVNEDASSTAANRIHTLTGANVVLRAGSSFATLSYNGTDARWILESTN